MTDKEMIEEMASCMCSSYKNEKACKTCPTNWCYADECATMAYYNNYRKIPEGSVVLSREEKQIEDMARDLCPIVYPKQCEKQCFNVGNCQELKEACEKIYNAGYRKIPEGSVVLSREEKQEYEGLAKLFIYDKPIKSRVYEFIKETKEQARKETARDILKELYEQIDEKTPKWVETQIKMKAKQFGVEVEE